jgi:outer membrane protein OmpA-like peptidoglycan-associated protein
MAAAVADVRKGMRVLDAGGAEQGVVDAVEGERIKVMPRGVSGKGEHWLPMSAIECVDDAVHIDRAASGEGGHFGLPPLRNAAVAGSQRRSNYYLPWVIGAVLLALLIIAAIALGNRHNDTGSAGVALPNGRTVAVAPGSLNDDVQRFLASTEPAPRTFSFDTLDFDNGKAEIPSRAEQGVATLAQILAAYPDARVEVVGYGDVHKDATARANATLGQRRAAAIAGALVARGVPTDSIEPVSGDDPAYVAATPPPAGDAGNRHADLVVVRK